MLNTHTQCGGCLLQVFHCMECSSTPHIGVRMFLYHSPVWVSRGPVTLLALWGNYFGSCYWLKITINSITVSETILFGCLRFLCIRMAESFLLSHCTVRTFIAVKLWWRISSDDCQQKVSKQWNFSIKDTLNKGTSLMRTLSAVPTTHSCVQMYLWITDTSLHRTVNLESPSILKGG